MSDDYLSWIAVPLVIVLGAIHLFKPKWGWVIGARRPLDFTDLEPLLVDKKLVRRPSRPGTRYPGAKNFQFLYNGASVLYHRTEKTAGEVVETVNVYVPHRVGMVYTLRNSRMVTLEKPRGSIYHDPILSPEHWDIVLNLTRRIRGLAHVRA